MKKLFGILVFLVVFGTHAAHGQEPIQFARMPDISPDGKLIAFSYLGDIWVVEAIGGVARPVTLHQAHETKPVFSPDGRHIAFSSNRHGSYDVFVSPVQGGRPRRITYDSASEFVNDWSPDGKQVLYTTRRGIDYPPMTVMYTSPVEGGRARKVTSFEGRDGSFDAQGRRIVYVAGPGTWYRKGYRGSANSDLWVSLADGSENQRMTNFNGQDTSPMWTRDGQSIIYVSEHFGTANICRMSLDSTGSPVQVTRHTEDNVRQARLSHDGQWLVYECGGDIWVCASEGEPRPRKIAIEAYADDKINPEKIVTFEKDISEFQMTADQRHIAFVVHGEIFMMPVSGGAARRLTSHPGNDHDLSWSPKKDKLLFISDRNGKEDIYVLESNDPKQKDITKSSAFKTGRLTQSDEPEVNVTFSPDGKLIAFEKQGRLWTMQPDGSKQKALVDTPTVRGYSWSPDSKYIVYSLLDGAFGGELYLIPAKGGESVNLTRYATRNYGASWSKDGKTLAFISERSDNLDVYLMSMQKPTPEGGPRSLLNKKFDLEDIHHRVRRVTSLSSPEMIATLKPDGAQVAFRSRALNADDLWVVSRTGGQLRRITSGNLGPRQIQWARAGSNVYFLDRHGSIRYARTTTTTSNPGTIQFKAKLKIDQDELYRQMFDEGWRKLSHRFYDQEHHGADWDALRQKYGDLVDHVRMKEDFYDLVKLMLGELNASHLGINGRAKSAEEQTAELGLIWDESYTGPGLRIGEILRRGPADRRGLKVKAGDYVMKIDGRDIDSSVNVSKQLNDKVNVNVTLSVTDKPNPPDSLALLRASLWASPMNALGAGLTGQLAVDSALDEVDLPPVQNLRNVVIRAAARNNISPLMYDRWVAANAAHVDKMSNGKLGYIHIKSMDSPSLERFVRSLYSDNYKKEGLVLDVRYNGGGFTHDKVLSYLGGDEHTYFVSRLGERGPVLRSNDRKWSKPVVLLCNNRSYSDAEIFPSAFRRLGLGKLVGLPTGGFVIGTVNQRLIDGSSFRIPHLGVYTAEGVNMEKVGVTPDFIVDAHPDELARGEDAQLIKAVEVLTGDVTAWKKSREAELAEDKPGTESRPTTKK